LDIVKVDIKKSGTEENNCTENNTVPIINQGTCQQDQKPTHDRHTFKPGDCFKLHRFYYLQC